MAACLNSGGGDSNSGSTNGGSGNSGGGAEGGGEGSCGGNGRSVTTSNEALLWAPTGGGTTRMTGIPWRREPVVAPASSGLFSWRGSVDAAVASFPGPGLPLPPVGRVDSDVGVGGAGGFDRRGVGVMLPSKANMTGNGMDFETVLPPENNFGSRPTFPLAHQHMERSTSSQTHTGPEHRQLPAVPQQGPPGSSFDASERALVPLRRSHHTSPRPTHPMSHPATRNPRAGIPHVPMSNAEMSHPSRRQHDILRQTMPHPDAPHPGVAHSEMLHSRMPRADFRHRDPPHAVSQGMQLILSPLEGISPRMGKTLAAVSGAMVQRPGASDSRTESIQPARTSAPLPQCPKTVVDVAQAVNKATSHLPQQVPSSQTAQRATSRALLPAGVLLTSPSERSRKDVAGPGTAPVLCDPDKVRPLPVASSSRTPETVKDIPTAVSQQPPRPTSSEAIFRAPSAPVSAPVVIYSPVMTSTTSSGSAPAAAPRQNLTQPPAPKPASPPKPALEPKPTLAPKPALAPKLASAPKPASATKSASSLKLDSASKPGSAKLASDSKPASTTKPSSSKQASAPKPPSASKPASAPELPSAPKPPLASKPSSAPKPPSTTKPASAPNTSLAPTSPSPKPPSAQMPASNPAAKLSSDPKSPSSHKPTPSLKPPLVPKPASARKTMAKLAPAPSSKSTPAGAPKTAAPKPASIPRPPKTAIPATVATSPPTKRSHGDGTEKAGADARSCAVVPISKKTKIAEIRPFSAPIEEPSLQIPEVSAADVGKVVLSETNAGTLTGVVEDFVKRGGLGVWRIRYENGELAETDDCGELHDDMCSYFEFVGQAATVAGWQVKSRNNFWLQEQVRVRLLKEDVRILGRRVCVVRNKELREGEVTEYVPPTRDGEIEQWRVAYAGDEHEDLESFELVFPLLCYLEKRIERREVQWGHRKLPAYIHRTDVSSRVFATLAGISASMPAAMCNDDDE